MKQFEIEMDTEKAGALMILHLREQSIGQRRLRLIAELPGVETVFSAPYMLKILKARVYDWSEIMIPMFAILGLPVPEEYAANHDAASPQSPPFNSAGKDVYVAWQSARMEEVKS